MRNPLRVFSHIARALPLAFLGCPPAMMSQSHAPTIAVINGVVWTGAPNQPRAEAVALSGDRIVAVGSTSEILARTSRQTRIIDAKGGMVLPGFIDSHVHFLAGGLNLASVQLRDAKTPAEFIARIKAYAATLPAGEWIIGGDLGHLKLGGGDPPAPVGHVLKPHKSV